MATVTNQGSNNTTRCRRPLNSVHPTVRYIAQGRHNAHRRAVTPRSPLCLIRAAVVSDNRIAAAAARHFKLQARSILKTKTKETNKKNCALTRVCATQDLTFTSTPGFLLKYEKSAQLQDRGFRPNLVLAPFFACVIFRLHGLPEAVFRFAAVMRNLNLTHILVPGTR